MVDTIFYWVVNMTVASSLTGLVIALLSMIKKIPRRVVSILWAIPFIRMALPFGISSKYSAAALINKIFTKTTPFISVVPSELGGITEMNYIKGANTYYPIIQYKKEFPSDLFRVCGIVWALVAAALFIAFLIIYIVTMREIKDAKPIGDRVYLSDKVTVPAVYGMIKPRIALPEETDDDRYILMHERTHIKRGDNVFRVLSLAVVCVHWFNPLCWLYLKMYYTDNELACDEAVTAKLTAEEKKEYARAILSSSERVSVFVPAFGGAKVRVRIENILSFKKITAASAISFVALILVLAYFLLTNA